MLRGIFHQNTHREIRIEPKRRDLVCVLAALARRNDTEGASQILQALKRLDDTREHRDRVCELTGELAPAHKSGGIGDTQLAQGILTRDARGEVQILEQRRTMPVYSPTTCWSEFRADILESTSVPSTSNTTCVYFNIWRAPFPASDCIQRTKAYLSTGAALAYILPQTIQILPSCTIPRRGASHYRPECEPELARCRKIYPHVHKR